MKAIATSTMASLLVAITAATFAGCGQPHGDRSQLQEAWDANNNPKLLGLSPLSYSQLVDSGALNGQTAKKPWADSYWPYFDKNIAWRYSGTQTFASVDAQVNDAQKNTKDAGLSPGEKFDLLQGDGQFALTRGAWATYNTDVATYGADPDAGHWNWMGMCNGWAAGALNVAAPAQHVLADHNGQQILFFAGDLRGLIDKAYDLNQAQAPLHMVGTRCDMDETTVAKDANGRPYDGKVIGGNATFDILIDNSLSNGTMEVTGNVQQPAPYWLAANAPIPKLSGPTPVSMYQYKDQTTLQTDLAAHTLGQHANEPDPMLVVFYKGCRDSNPASVHLGLVERLATNATNHSSLIVDTSRYSQVWNYPLWGYSTKVGPQVPIAQDTPATRSFRAPTTAFVASVETTLVMITEVTPQIAYSADPLTTIDWSKVGVAQSPYTTTDLKYTLEFDAAGNIVGGEWDESPSTSIAALDFIWAEDGLPTDLTSNGSASPLPFSKLQKLLDCSQQTTTEPVTTTVNGQSQTFPAVRCSI